MKRTLIVVFAALFALSGVAVMAQEDNVRDTRTNAGQHQLNPGTDDESHGKFRVSAQVNGSGLLINHGGPVMNFGKVVFIFWGSTLTPTSSYVTEVQSLRSSSSGLVSHTGMLTQYGVSETTLVGSQADKFDSTNPSSTRVTDAMVQAEVKKFFSGAYDTNTVYEVFIPNGFYSYDGGATSCGGPHLQYCAYHSNGSGGTGLPTNIKYSIQPYPSCSGCKASGFNTNQNQEMFVGHETREALTDPLGTAWWDAAGYEADDKCAWISLFLQTAADGHTYGYQPEFSNSANNCVQ